ncbi:flavin-binding monooxygenase-like protein-like protein [Pyrenochaeta sp. MPI-SDFR-AT-0127]|nr:flavin-binding monooxygenase-like protein-like protein [Pyrenochaeta sp. MPI-SDFR-AT-0127]
MERVDLVIIGAGIYGLTSASTYHRLHPEARILIVEASRFIGGPWASDRSFPGLKTNNLWGMYEHPDFPMDEQTFGVKRGEHIPAEKMLEYLTAFVDWSGVRQFLKLQTRVEVIEKSGEGWTLTCVSESDEGRNKDFNIYTPKIIIAVGNHNKPLTPKYLKSSSFNPLVIHSKDFPNHFHDIVKPSTHTLIIGGSKSSWDIAYACATEPSNTSTATVLIRPSGNGPLWMTPSHVTPLTLWLEKLVFTRFFGFMSPCPWAQMSGIEGWLRSFFQGTWLGRKITGAFWHILGEDAISLNKLDDHPETRKLRPWRSAFEIGNGLSIHNYPTNFYDLVRTGRIKIVIDEVDNLAEGKEVRLKSGDTIQADAVVYATGWQVGNTFKFKPEGLEQELGMPNTRPLDPEHQALIQKTEAELYKGFPFLTERDSSREHHPDPSLRYTQEKQMDQKQQPYRLHRFIAPPAALQDRSIVFAGALLTLGTFSCAYIQSLWITAYFDDTLSAPFSSPENIQAKVYRDTQYCVLRGPTNHGRILPDVVFDTLPYFDLLLRDLGLQGRRKGGVLGVRECVRSYGPQDYRGLLVQWEGRRSEETKKGV